MAGMNAQIALLPRQSRPHRRRPAAAAGSGARMDCGIEFEYMLVDAGGETPGRIRDHGNLDFARMQALLADRPGRDDASLATGDLGIKSGYWYLEGDERFHADGRFRTLAVKGVEIRTPPVAGVAAAIRRLLEIEAELAATLARHGFGLAIGGFNPLRPGYEFAPPLNDWERELRQGRRAYDGSQVSTLSYGPDINLSSPAWNAEAGLDAARKLNHYAPWILPFSFSSPFHAGAPWGGWSKRTFERAPLRPAVKYYVAPADLARLQAVSPLVHAARIPREAGRIEFKAFDAMPAQQLLAACCHLLVGICRADDLPGRSETADVALCRKAAVAGFDAADIAGGAALVLEKAAAALRRHGEDAGALDPLAALLAARRTPAHDLLAAYRRTGLMVRPGGLGAAWGVVPAAFDLRRCRAP